MDETRLPKVVISLDFEMRWGMHDKLGIDFDAYRENLENVRVVVPALLKLFSERKINATWACVGALGCQNWDDYFRRAPSPPQYENSSLKVNARYAEIDPNGYLHFAPELLYEIHNTAGQELGTHTFSHLYLREPGITAEDVQNDLIAFSELWHEMFGYSPISFVFPRNQVAFLSVIRSSSIHVWRGNEEAWHFNCNEVLTNASLPRMLRLIEAVNPLVRRAAPLVGGMTRSSLFLRSNLNRPMWALHYKRIRMELNQMKAGEIFHLWWHPHNLGSNVKCRLSRVEMVLDLIAERCEKRLLISNSMNQLIS